MKNLFSRLGLLLIIFVVTVFSCAAIVSAPETDSPATTAKKTDDQVLVDRLMHDKLVDQVKGFVVEKKSNQLFIDGKDLGADLSRKYLSALKQDHIRVQVFPFTDRLHMHQDASLIQLLFPISTSSECVAKANDKPGC